MCEKKMGNKKEKVFEPDKGFSKEMYKNGWTAKNLKYFRNLRRISKKKICDELNINMGLYSDFENCIMSPTLSEIVMLADYLHVSVDVLVGRKTGAYEYQLELSNLIFALNTQFEVVQHKLEQDDKCVFEVGNLKVAISSRELGVQDRRLPDEKIMEKVLSNAEYLDNLFQEKEKEYNILFETRQKEFDKILLRREEMFNKKLKLKEEEILKRENRLKRLEEKKGVGVIAEDIEHIDIIDFSDVADSVMNEDKLMMALKKNVGLSNVTYDDEE